MSNFKYDVAIIGGGIGGLMAAYRLCRNIPDIKIVITERGNTLENRHCPAGKNNTSAPPTAARSAKNWAMIPRINILMRLIRSSMNTAPLASLRFINRMRA